LRNGVQQVVFYIQSVDADQEGPDRFRCSLCNYVNPHFQRVRNHIRTAHIKILRELPPDQLVPSPFIPAQAPHLYVGANLFPALPVNARFEPELPPLPPLQQTPPPPPSSPESLIGFQPASNNSVCSDSGAAELVRKLVDCSVNDCVDQMSASCNIVDVPADENSIGK
jgi:hypothetical protein